MGRGTIQYSHHVIPALPVGAWMEIKHRTPRTDVEITRITCSFAWLHKVHSGGAAPVVDVSRPA